MGIYNGNQKQISRYAQFITHVYIKMCKRQRETGVCGATWWDETTVPLLSQQQKSILWYILCPPYEQNDSDQLSIGSYTLARYRNAIWHYNTQYTTEYHEKTLYTLHLLLAINPTHFFWCADGILQRWARDQIFLYRTGYSHIHRVWLCYACRI